MDYRLELMDEDSFEKMVVTICKKILGIGTVSFAPGKDGGKDGKFIGTAANFPSESAPWSGQFIIQAKHTINSQASCSDSDFENQILNKEIPKVNKLKADGKIDNYILFTNRKYTGVKGDALTEKIKVLTGLDNVIIIGKGEINDQYLNNNRDIVKLYELDRNHIPFDFSDEEIRDVILAFKKEIPKFETSLKAEIEKVKYSFDKVSLGTKNKKNDLSEDYFTGELVSRSLMDFGKIQYFLNDPINKDYKDYFFDSAVELNQMITVKRDSFGVFEEVFLFIYKKVCDGNKELKGSKRHVITLLHFMYAECLIGKK